jgi:hypothetical protein
LLVVCLVCLPYRALRHSGVSLDSGVDASRRLEEGWIEAPSVCLPVRFPPLKPLLNCLNCLNFVRSFDFVGHTSPATSRDVDDVDMLIIMHPVLGCQEAHRAGVDAGLFS